MGVFHDFLITVIKRLDKQRKYYHKFQLLQLFQSYEEIPRDMKIYRKSKFFHLVEPKILQQC